MAAAKQKSEVKVRRSRHNRPRGRIDRDPQSEQGPHVSIPDEASFANKASAHSSIEQLQNGRIRTAQRQDLAFRISQVQGNRRFQQALECQKLSQSTVQRNGGASPAAAAQKESQPIWNIPFDIGKAVTENEAKIGLLWMAIRLEELADLAEGESSTTLRSNAKIIRSDWLPNYEGDSPLTSTQTAELNAAGLLVEGVYNRHFESIRSKIVQALEPLQTKPVDTSEEEAELAEALHAAFIKNDVDQVARVSSAISNLQDYNENVRNVAGWAKTVSTALGKAKIAGMLEKAIGGSETFEKVLSSASDSLKAARLIARLGSRDQQTSNEVFRMIGDFEAGIDVIDVTMKFTQAVPLLGTLWSKYYKPVIDQCMILINQIAVYEDMSGRQLANVFDWYQDAIQENAGIAPKIPKDELRYFPGGQPVFDFMWQIMHGIRIKPESEVEKFFIANRELFVPISKRFPLLYKRSSRFWDPSTWDQKESIQFLDIWALQNRGLVWGILYGRYLEPPG